METPEEKPRFISCVARSVQRRSERVASCPALARLRMKRWRVELTALSRAYNLYFVACDDVILIFQPKFPYQDLTTPALVLRPPITTPSRPQYIDPSDPHAINRLHVDYLGRKEILLTASDNGDVVGYYVSAIMAAIEQKQSSASQEDITNRDSHGKVDALRAFFTINGGASAWGLAIHREACKIAVSANGGKITVVEFELVPSSAARRQQTNNMSPQKAGIVAGMSMGQGRMNMNMNNPNATMQRLRADIQASHLQEDQTREQMNAAFRSTNNMPPHNIQQQLIRLQAIFQQKRKELLRLHAMGGVQCPNPPTGPYRIVTIRSSAPTNIPSICFDNNGTDELGRWLLASDISGNTTVHDLHDFHGWVEVNVGHCASIASKNNNGCTHEPYHHAAWGGFFVNGYTCHRSESSWEAFGGSPDWRKGLLDTTRLKARMRPTTQASANLDLPLSVLIEWGVSADDLEWAVDDSDNESVAGSMQSDEAEDEHGPTIPEGGEPLAETGTSPTPMENQQSIPGAGRDNQNQRKYALDNYYSSSKAGSSNAERMPGVLIVTAEEVYLNQPGLPGKSLVAMRRPLLELSRRPQPRERMCYSHYVPELGIFLVGSPDSGKCAIFSITHLSKEAGNGKEDMYGFRREYVLPHFKSHDFGPFNHLVGIACGPIQGRLDNPEGERDDEYERGNRWPRIWRLFLHYEDHSVLTYDLEVVRPKDEPSLASLVV